MRKKFFFLGILLGVCLASPAQFYSARTNLIGLATGNINLEGSMTLNRRWSLHLPVQYNPFVFKDNRQFRNLTVMPGVRYWFVESYSTFFVGMNTLTLKDLPQQDASSGNSFLSMIMMLSMSIGVALAGTLINVFGQHFSTASLTTAFHATLITLGCINLVTALVFWQIPKEMAD